MIARIKQLGVHIMLATTLVVLLPPLLVLLALQTLLERDGGTA